MQGTPNTPTFPSTKGSPAEIDADQTNLKAVDKVKGLHS